MLEQLLVFEREAFFALNGSSSPYWDRFMWLFSSKAVWVPLALFIVGLLVYKKNWREWLLVLAALALVITFCDQFASGVCKPLFTRFRPTHHPDFMEQVKVVFDYRGGRYGFISSHAANAFGFATFMTLLFRYKWLSLSLFVWAVVNTYSRIYLGVHFISDVVPGMLAGIFFGFVTYSIYRYARGRFLPDSPTPLPDRLYSNSRKQLIVYAIWATIGALLLFNSPLVSLLR